jgi:hypothetical protein
VIGNWAGGRVITPFYHVANCLRAEWGLRDAFVVGYSGDLGRAHESGSVMAITTSPALVRRQPADK